MPKRPPSTRALGNLRPVPDPGPTASRLRLLGPAGRLEVSALGPDVFRLQAEPSGPARRRQTPSWALPERPSPSAEAEIKRRGDRFALRTSAATWEVQAPPGAWQLVDRHGLVVFESGPGGVRFSGPRTDVALRLTEREALFGLGESTGPFNKRGLIRELWNIDVLGHASGIHPNLRSLYVSIPFALSLRDGRVAGLFWDNPARQVWDLGLSNPGEWRLTADAGPVDLYLFVGPTPADVLRRFTELTGRIPLPPRWALGYHQCRYSYESRAELERVAREFRQRRIPCDALYCDIHHLDGYRVFTFGRNYPQPRRLIAGLARRGFKVVSIVDPGVKDDPRFGVLQRGRRLGAFVKNPSGRGDFLGQAWPGACRFPDFLNARVRDWWGAEQQALLDLGVAGFWNDMNEPANFALPTKTLDLRCRHQTDHGPRRHAEVHNLYGQQMARASREGALRCRPDTRPFVISRAGWAGIQRHALVWTGDNASCWEHLADSIQLLLNLGLSGVPFVGGDVGGFLDSPTPELFLRWLQMAVFTPFLRNHTGLGTRAQEPWAFGPEVETIARRYLDLRYQLLPYLYGLFAKAAVDGTPIMRPLLWHFPNDPAAAACEDQFLLGDALLVAPVVRPGVEVRSVYLPRGEWFDFWTGERHRGGAYLLTPTPRERLPLFVPAGTLLPLAETRPFVGAREPETVFLHLWPGGPAEREWYDDDGQSQGWQNGNWQRRQFTAHATPRNGWLRLGAPHGPYRGHTRTWRVVVRGLTRRCRTTLQRRPHAASYDPQSRLLIFDLPVTDEPLDARWY